MAATRNRSSRARRPSPCARAVSIADLLRACPARAGTRLRRGRYHGSFLIRCAISPEALVDAWRSSGRSGGSRRSAARGFRARNRARQDRSGLSMWTVSERSLGHARRHDFGLIVAAADDTSGVSKNSLVARWPRRIPNDARGPGAWIVAPRRASALGRLDAYSFFVLPAHDWNADYAVVGTTGAFLIIGVRSPRSGAGRREAPGGR